MQTITNAPADSGLGDSLKISMDKINSNFTETLTLLGGKEPTIPIGNTSQYRRGDKTWQTLDKAAVGLNNVDNTTDALKPVSNPTQAALNLKADIASPTFSWFAGIDTTILSPTTAFQITLNGTESARITKAGQMKASRFELYGGLASQFLMADGSTLTSSFMTNNGGTAQRYALFGTNTNQIGNGQIYETGGNVIVGGGAPTMSAFFEVMGSVKGNSFSVPGGTATGFLKANGTVDSTNYALAVNQHNPVSILTANGLSILSVPQQLSLGLASSTANGALSSTDWTTFNNKQNSLPYANSSVDGILRASDWNVFNNKQNALSYANGSTDGILRATDWSIFNNKMGASTDFTVRSPLGRNGGSLASGTLQLIIVQATNTSDGYLTSGDWNTFNNKQNALSPANGSTNGYLTAADWNTFNGKQNALSNPVVGTGTGNYITKWNAGNSVTNSQIYDNGTTVGIGTTGASEKLQVNGNVLATAFFITSDIRYKNVINPTHADPTEIKPITYTWKDEEKGFIPEIGYSAQEVQKVMPDSVKADADGFLSVNYIQVLVAKMAKMEERIKELEEKLKQ